MLKTINFLLKTKIMLGMEVVLLVITMFCLLWLKNVLVGAFYLLFIINLFLWLILIIMTVNLYNRVKMKEEKNLISNKLKIPEKDRYKFAQPLGRLIEGTRKETILQVEKIIRDYQKSIPKLKFYIVGDIVTQDFLANTYLNSFIRLCIIDERTQRNEIKIGNENFFEEIIEFENPQGSINRKSFILLEKIIQSNKKTLLKITKGEEDLLVLPLVLKLPLNKNETNFVFYGQPPITDAKFHIPEGIVIVEINKRIQRVVKKFLSIMDGV